MDKTPEELFQERTRRIEDAVQLKVPDRVPFAPICHYFPARYSGIGFQEVMYNYDKLAMAIKKMVLELQPDACPDTFRVLSWASTLEALDYKLLKWPGHGVNPDVTFQFVEGEYMKAEEYDAFLLDPSDFLMRTYLPRICGTLEPLKMLRPLIWGWYTRMVSIIAAFGKPEVITALESLVKAGKEAQTMISRGSAFTKEMAALGFPRQFVGSVTAPFDYIGDYLRGTRGIMIDMYRNPDKLLEACEKILPWMIEQGTSVPKTEGPNRIFIPLHKGLDGFMSLEQFKIFFWPTLKKLMLAIIDAGLIPNPIFEGDCTSRLEIIGDIPKGKAIYWFEHTDLVKAKEVLGDRVCIEGGLPASLLCTGTPEEVRAYCKTLIDNVGKGGGFIMNGAIGIPDEAKIENVKAMAEFVREYGVYN
jgi:uroporphyrinogen-III decarboxylase